MKQEREPLSEFGIKVTVFCAKFGFTKKQLAQEAGVPYVSLLAATTRRRAGHATREAVEPIMEKYEAEAQRGQRRGRGA